MFSFNIFCVCFLGMPSTPHCISSLRFVEIMSCFVDSLSWSFL